ncbi:MAG: cell envelope integrity protein CreD, partial [Tannerella sp.]|nr:cell envelope integrity protein CreD [Tannerella sp.]
MDTQSFNANEEQGIRNEPAKMNANAEEGAGIRPGTANGNKPDNPSNYSAPASGNFPPRPSNNDRPDFFSRNQLAIKAILIGMLTLLLMIPMLLINELIKEREQTANMATSEVNQKWSGSQVINGPMLTFPVYELVKNMEGKTEKAISAMQIFPEELNIRSEIETQDLKRGLYEIVVYNSTIEISGSFVLPDELKNLSDEALKDIFFQDAMLNIGISDLRGISEQVEVKWGDTQISLDPGIKQAKLIESGISAPVDIQALLNAETVAFSMTIKLKGSSALYFVPLGKTTVVEMHSNATTPSFTGSFLPVDRNVTDTGFTADWKVMHLNRNYPQVITGDRWQYDVGNSAFGVSMLMPVQHYQKSMRSVKYAILIILLTFVVSFFVEISQKKSIHPFQYLLIGAALCLFYSLL